jgi:hypothetical protein
LAQSTTIFRPSSRISSGSDLLDRVDIAPARILDPAGPADLFAGASAMSVSSSASIASFVLVRQLEAIGAEQLDAVVG